jgi:hypothetical protein
VSKLSSAILADFDMRGNAISVWTASIVLLGSFLGLLLFMIHSVIRRYSFLMIQTIKQITTKVPTSPYPNIVVSYSPMSLFFG